MAKWLVHLSTKPVVWVQSQAKTGLIFLGLTYIHKNVGPTTFRIFWDGKVMRKDSGNSHLLCWRLQNVKAS